MSNDKFELFWLLAHADNPVISFDQFMSIPEVIRNVLLDTGLIEETQFSRTVECDGCEEGHVEEVQQEVYPDGKRRFFIPCPECTCVEVDPKRLRQWGPNYSKMADLLHESLNCKGSVQAIVPQSLWNVGRAALAGQSRSIYLAKAIAEDVKQKLPKGKQPLLFIIFPQQTEVDCFEPDRTFQLNQHLNIKDGLIRFDIDSIKMQLDSLLASRQPTRKAPRKDAKRAAVIKAAKKELHQHIISMKSLLANTDQELPIFTQKQLAELTDTSETMVSNILKKEPDELLKLLWETANNPDMIRDYKRKRG